MPNIQWGSRNGITSINILIWKREGQEAHGGHWSMGIMNSCEVGAMKTWALENSRNLLDT